MHFWSIIIIFHHKKSINYLGKNRENEEKSDKKSATTNRVIALIYLHLIYRGYFARVKYS